MASPPFGPLVLASLEGLAARGIDLTPRVYARLFALYPHYEGLFILGPGAKGRMLDEVTRLVLDFADHGAYGDHMLAAERVNHEQLGVAAEDFLGFLDLVAVTVADLSGDAFTAAHSDAWRHMIAELKAKTDH
jgi:hemoglobin-like flavoprotein